MRKYITTFLLIISCGLVLYFIVNLGWYPVAIVEGKIITKNLFQKEYEAALRYYGNIAGQEGETKEFKREIKRAVLDGLIEGVLIYKRLKEEMGVELAEAVNKKLNSLEFDEAAIEEAASVLYGLTFQEFKDIVLIPQASKEILEARLLSRQQDIDNWLTDARNNTSVILLIREFSWENGTVVGD